MKSQLLKQIIAKKEKKTEFAIITNLKNGESCIFEKNKPLDENFEKLSDRNDFLVLVDEAHRTQYGFQGKIKTKLK